MLNNVDGGRRETVWLSSCGGGGGLASEIFSDEKRRYHIRCNRRKSLFPPDYIITIIIIILLLGVFVIADVVSSDVSHRLIDAVMGRSLANLLDDCVWMRIVAGVDFECTCYVSFYAVHNFLALIFLSPLFPVFLCSLHTRNYKHVGIIIFS